MKVLIIGLGSMGRRRVRNLKSLGIRNIIGFDLRADRRKTAANDYSIDTLDSWGEAANCGADCWIVSTPPLTHLGYALEALLNNAHVFVEADLPDTRHAEVIALRDQTGLVAAPSCTMRYLPGPHRITQMVKDRSVGQPLLFTYHSGQYLPDWHPWETLEDYYVSRSETGAAREMVPFELVWLIDLFGPVIDVTGQRGRTGQIDAEIDDYYQLTLSFEDQVSGQLLVDVVSRPAVRHFRLVGSTGIIEWDQGEGRVQIWNEGNEKAKVLDLSAGTPEPGYISPEEPYIAEMKDFLAAVRGDQRFPFSFDEEKSIHEALVTAERSCKQVPAA